MTRGFSFLFYLLLLVGCMCPQFAAGQTAAPDAPPREEPGPLIDSSHCRTIMAADPRGTALSALCEFALAYRRQLPDFICGQTTTSHLPRGKIASEAQVRFENGHEHYSHVTVQGESKDGVGTVVGFQSSGELGTTLVDLFMPPVVAEFQFHKDGELRGIPSSEYEFRVAAEKNTFWRVRDGRGTVVVPEYKGQIWLARPKGTILRIKLHPVHLPSNFEFDSIDMTVDYGATTIADAGVFLLPNSSETTVCRGRGYLPFCLTHTLAFHDCKKFGAKSRILDSPEP